MTQSYVFREQAVRAAKKAGYTGFRTVLNESEMWVPRYVGNEPSPAAEYADAHDFVHHAETEFVGNQKYGVLVVNITLDELHLEHGSVYGPDDPDEAYWFVPGLSADGPRYIVEPLVRELWQPDPPPGTRRGSDGSGPRERSTMDSPVKTVHRICDEMKGRSRKEIIDACVALGVNKSTANTQFYHWSKKNLG